MSPESETLVKVKVPTRYGKFEDAHGKSHGPGALVEVTPRVAAAYDLAIVTEKALAAEKVLAEEAAAKPRKARK